MDGTRLEPGQPGETSLDVDDGRGLTVRWTFPPAPAATRVFQITYHAIGAVAVQGARGTIRRTAIPSDRSYPSISAAGRADGRSRAAPVRWDGHRRSRLDGFAQRAMDSPPSVRGFHLERVRR